MLAIGYSEEHGYLWSIDAPSNYENLPQSLAEVLTNFSWGICPDWIIVVNSDEIRCQYHLKKDYTYVEYQGDF